MISLKRSLLLLSPLLSVCAAAVSAHPPKAASDLAALQAVDQQWEQAFNAGDVNKVTSLYAADAVLLPPDATVAYGQKAIREFFTQFVADSRKSGITLHLGAKPDGGVSGDWGWCSGTYTATDKSGKVVDTGKYLSVPHKENGVWRYVRDTWNSDAPAAAPTNAQQ